MKEILMMIRTPQLRKKKQLKREPHILPQFENQI